MVVWGVVFVFGAILGPVIGVLVWPFLLREVFAYYKRSRSSKRQEHSSRQN